MNEPLKGKGFIDDVTRVYLELRWFKKDGTEYKGNISWDNDYNAYDDKDELLEGKYFDEDGTEVKYTVFSVESVKSAVEFYKRYECNYELLAQEKPEIYKKSIIANDHYPPNDHRMIQYNRWLFKYTFGDVIE